MELKKNDILRVVVDSLTLEGYGICRPKDLPVIFVTDCAAGDILDVRILKVKKSYAFGKIENVVQPSEDRIEPDCPSATKCGGCSFRHINYKSELKIKQQAVTDAIEKIAGLKNVLIKPIVASKMTVRYRNKTIMPVSEVKSEVKVGFFAKNTHRIVNCYDCLLQPVIFVDIIETFKKWLIDYQVSIYDEKTHQGILRNLYIRYGDRTGDIAVCIVANTEVVPNIDSLVNNLVSKISNLKSVTLNVNTEDTNVVLGEMFVTLWGDAYISDILCNLTFYISMKAFYQVNRFQTENLYDIVKKYANCSKTDTVLDLYCGIGTIGLSMAEDAREIIGIDNVKDAISNAVNNISLNNITNAKFICSDVDDAIVARGDVKQADVVIIDPPRKGCSVSLIKSIKEISPRKVVYVSCNPSTLARDLKVFDVCGYRVIEITPVDMFPRTGHVETVCLLSRK